MRNKVSLAMACFVFSGLLVGLGSPVRAACPSPSFAGIDGVCLIKQPINSCAGFPIKITKTGSYKLFSNLTVSCPNKDAIDVAPSDGGPVVELATVDLNGFSIIGPGSGAGIGINAFAATSLVVHNGGIAAMGAGIVAKDCKVEEVHLLLNVGTAIDCDDGVILNDTVAANGGDGISVFDGVVQGNKVLANQFEGIFAFAGLVQNNTVIDNGGGIFSPNGSPGIDVMNATVTENNVFVNGGDGIDVGGGGSKVGENSVVGNSGDGIDVESFVTGVNVIGNTADDNGGFGIRFFDATSAFTSNVVHNNGDSGACSATPTCNGEVCGGTSPIFASSNVCNGLPG